MTPTAGGTPDLLDANVLIALAWPNHVHHGLVHHWFSQRRNLSWASCATTETAFLRISMNPKIHGVPVEFGHALELLTSMTGRPDHTYWSELPSPIELAATNSMLVQGHGQVTDAYLLALAHHYGGRLATLDSGVPTLISRPSKRRQWVELIRA